MRLSDLQDKDIVSIADGAKFGKIIDAVLDDNGIIKALIIQKTKVFNLFFGGNEIEIKWENIKTIGNDVILVDTNL